MRRTRYSMLSLLLLVSLLFITALPEPVAAADTGTPKVVFIGKPIKGELYLGDDNTVLAISKGKPYFLDMQGNVLLSTKQLDKIVKKAGGKLIDDDEYTVRNFSEGYAVIQCVPAKECEDMVLSIYFDKKGKIAFTAPGEGGSFHDGIAIVNSNMSETPFSRAYDTQGNLIGSIKGNNGTFVSYGNGIYVRNFEGVNKYVDSNNKPVIKNYFAFAGRFDNNLIAPVADYAGNIGFINSNGEIFLDFKYNGCGYLDPKTKTYFSEGLCNVGDWEGGNSGYIDTTGKLVIPYKFGSADPFENGLARVTATLPNGVRGGYGYIDTTGKIVIPTDFDYMTFMMNGYCLGENDKGCTIFDETGKAYKNPKMDLGDIDTLKNVNVFIYDAPGHKKGMATIQ